MVKFNINFKRIAEFEAGLEVERVLKDNLLKEILCNSIIETNLLGFHELKQDSVFYFNLDVLVNNKRKELISEAFLSCGIDEKVELLKIAVLNGQNLKFIGDSIKGIIQVPIRDFSNVVLNNLSEEGNVELGEKYLLYKQNLGKL